MCESRLRERQYRLINLEEGKGRDLQTTQAGNPQVNPKFERGTRSIMTSLCQSGRLPTVMLLAPTIAILLALNFRRQIH